MEEIKNTTENPDSLSIGTAKEGIIKVYCDFSQMEEAQEKVKNAFALMELARGLYSAGKQNDE